MAQEARPIAMTVSALNRAARTNFVRPELLERLGERHYRVGYREDPDAKPDFMAGLFEEGLRRTGVEPTVTVAHREPHGFDLEMRW